MRTVLYTDDMEPITVVEVGRWAMQHIEQRGYVQLAVSEPFQVEAVLDQVPTFQKLRTVTIYGERLIRNNVPHWMLFTRDEENALLLQSAFLPGQQAALNEAKRKAFARGFLHALARDL